jgi:hypothetical protein
MESHTSEICVQFLHIMLARQLSQNYVLQHVGLFLRLMFHLYKSDQ